jgi:hypothetical protein
MKLPVCIFDLESDMLCSSCQEKLDSGMITRFDLDFSRWLLERHRNYPELEDLTLLRAAKTDGMLVLVVKRKNKELLESIQGLMDEIRQAYGKILIIEGPAKLRDVVRSLIEPATEIGVNSLYLPDGHRETIVMLRARDEDRIAYSLAELRAIVSTVMGETVLFGFEKEKQSGKGEEAAEQDAFDARMRELSQKRA